MILVNEYGNIRYDIDDPLIIKDIIAMGFHELKEEKEEKPAEKIETTAQNERVEDKPTVDTAKKKTAAKRPKNAKKEQRRNER